MAHKIIQQELNCLCTAAQSYKAMRDEIYQRGLKNLPCIPVLAITLTDFTFINEGYMVELPHGHFNFNKWHMTVQAIDRYFEATRCNAEYFKTKNIDEKMMQVIHMIHHVQGITEDELYERSIILEPRKTV